MNQQIDFENSRIRSRPCQQERRAGPRSLQPLLGSDPPGSRCGVQVHRRYRQRRPRDQREGREIHRGQSPSQFRARPAPGSCQRPQGSARHPEPVRAPADGNLRAASSGAFAPCGSVGSEGQPLEPLLSIPPRCKSWFSGSCTLLHKRRISCRIFVFACLKFA